MVCVAMFFFLCHGHVSISFILVFFLFPRMFPRLGRVTLMSLPYISVACGRTDFRRVKLLPPDREPHYSSPV